MYVKGEKSRYALLSGAAQNYEKIKAYLEKYSGLIEFSWDYSTIISKNGDNYEKK